MKSLIIAPLLAFLFFNTSCTPGLDSPSVGNIDTTGTWRVSLFTDNGTNETIDFAGYSFSFNGNGTVSATKSGTTQNGTWSLSAGSGKFNIDLGPKTNANKPLGELTDDWKIIVTSFSEIKLKDDNTTSTEFLTFTKN